jgi:hypothetical protein
MTSTSGSFYPSFCSISHILDDSTTSQHTVVIDSYFSFNKIKSASGFVLWEEQFGLKEDTIFISVGTKD